MDVVPSSLSSTLQPVDLCSHSKVCTFGCLLPISLVTSERLTAPQLHVLDLVDILHYKDKINAIFSKIETLRSSIYLTSNLISTYF